MSELAFNLAGMHFDPPPGAAGWRVRRLKAKGAPEMVYGRNGQPLVLPIDADVGDLRREVEEPGRYRVDALDEMRQPIPNVEAGYVYVHDVERTDPNVNGPRGGKSDNAVIEAMRLNADMARTNADIARSVVDRFAAMLEASAGVASTLTQAASGIGLLPHNQVRLIASAHDESPAASDAPGRADLAPAAPGFDLTALVAQLAPVVVTALCDGKITLPGLSRMFGRKPSAPAAPVDDGAARPLALPERDASPDAPASGTDGARGPRLDMAGLAHFAAIQSRLTAEEGELARAMAAELSAEELRAWFDDLRGLDAEAAAAKVRTIVARESAEVSA